jgi:phosphate transport system protein
VNRLHDETFATLVGMLEAGHEHAEALAHLLTVSKALERISDHTKNIAQGIIFMIEGRDIRHGDLAQSEGEPSSDGSASGEASPSAA